MCACLPPAGCSIRMCLCETECVVQKNMLRVYCNTGAGFSQLAGEGNSAQGQVEQAARGGGMSNFINFKCIARACISLVHLGNAIAHFSSVKVFIRHICCTHVVAHRSEPLILLSLEWPSRLGARTQLQRSVALAVNPHGRLALLLLDAM